MTCIKPNLFNFLRWRARFAARLTGRFLPCRRAGDVKTIVCFICGGLGDRLMALPALRRLRVVYPEARMCVAWMDGSLEVADREFDEIHNTVRAHPLTAIRIAMRKWDVVYVNEQGIFSVCSEWCAAVSRAPVRIGPVIGGCNDPVFNRPYAVDPDRHVTVTNYRGVDVYETDKPIGYDIHLHKRKIIDENKGWRRIGIHPGVGKGYEIKRWPLQCFRELLDRIVNDFEAEPVLFAGPGEEREIQSLRSNRIGIVATPDIGSLFDALGSCDLFIANDSGPAHAAASIGVPLIVLFGPTDPVKVGPVFKKGEIVRGDCPKAPCFDQKNVTCGRNECMDSISVETVIAAVKRLL